jgi:cobalt-zinc-cadmium efflux system protein
MVAVAGVTEVHELHVWEVTSGFPALSAHVLVREDSDCHELAGQLKRVLDNEFDIEHTTLQVDHEQTELLSIEPAEQVQRSLRHVQRS